METTPPAPSNYLVDGPILATLFCFGNLTEITLEPPVGFDIDDETVADMARAWPKLKSLCLMANSDLHHPLEHVAEWPLRFRQPLLRANLPHYRLRRFHSPAVRRLFGDRSLPILSYFFRRRRLSDDPSIPRRAIPVEAVPKPRDNQHTQ